MIKFERVSKYPDAVLPKRATTNSAGYDFCVAEDTLIPAYQNMMYNLQSDNFNENNVFRIFSLDEIAEMTKVKSLRPTLVPTGIKCHLEPDTYLELAVRSSLPLKHWLILANAIGVIDCDFYNAPDGEGEIYFQLINLSPFNIVLKKGDRIGQGIIHRYLTTDDDAATGDRTGGFGSTSK